MANTIEQPTVGTKTIWTLDPSHSQVSFAAKHMMVTTVRGTFGEVTGKIALDENDFTKSEVEATIDVAGLTTRDEKRDGHLRSADFFDAENHPAATFKSTKIVSKGGDKYEIAGDLTVRGETKPVVLQAEYDGKGVNPWGQEIMGFSATTEINRKDWGLNWNVALEAGGWLVAEKIKLEIATEAKRAQ
jgi:polyisoprenoid-binding protein YceI